MRKILILIMCFAMVGTSVIASAAEVTPYSDDMGVAPIVLNGKWMMNDTIDVDTLSTFTDLNSDSFYYYDTNGLYQKLWVDSYGVWSILNPFNDAREETIYLYNDEDDCWNVDFTHYWSFQGVVVPSDFLIWLNDNGTEIHCDGSSCPAEDVNENLYCDNCYARLLIASPPTVTAPYPDNLPTPPSEALGNNREIIVMRTNDTIKLYSYNHEIRSGTDDYFYYVWGNSNNNDVILEATHSSATGNAYELVGDTWQFSGILSGDYTLGKQPDILYSSVIIYDENGEYFFPLTLWAQILKVTQGEMKIQTPKLGSLILLLTTCGIGLLVLLIAYPLLRKVLYKFL